MAQERGYTFQELLDAGLIGPAYCNCLDDYPVLGPSGLFCSYCDTIAKLDEETAHVDEDSTN